MLGIVIQARLGSTRLPNKMLIPFYDGKGVLELLLERLLLNFKEVPIIVATTTKDNDDDIVKLCEKHKVNFHRGSENDVLERYIEVGNRFKLKKIIRICADNPFLNVNFLEMLIAEFLKADCDYISYKTEDGTPVIKTHFGFWGEGITLDALKKVKKQTREQFYLEHVTNYIYENEELFKISFLNIDSYFKEYKNIRMTLDTKEDFLVLKEIYEEYVRYDCKENVKSLLKLVDSNEMWKNKMNKQIINNTK